VIQAFIVETARIILKSVRHKFGLIIVKYYNSLQEHIVSVKCVRFQVTSIQICYYYYYYTV